MGFEIGTKMRADERQRIIVELKAVRANLEAWLAHQRAIIYRDMREVEPGVWLHNRYPDVNACLKDLGLI